jgi:hypothetical protein
MMSSMNRSSFLTLSSAIAFAVAGLAFAFPHALLSGKGVTPDPAPVVWVREVGALIFAAGVTTYLCRKAPDSLALRAVLTGNAVLHLTLFPIELIAFTHGVITKLEGVLPNSLLHIALATGFIVTASRVRDAPRELTSAPTPDRSPRTTIAGATNATQANSIQRRPEAR